MMGVYLQLHMCSCIHLHSIHSSRSLANLQQRSAAIFDQPNITGEVAYAYLLHGKEINFINFSNREEWGLDISV